MGDVTGHAPQPAKTGDPRGHAEPPVDDDAAAAPVAPPDPVDLFDEPTQDLCGRQIARALADPPVEAAAAGTGEVMVVPEPTRRRTGAAPVGPAATIAPRSGDDPPSLLERSTFWLGEQDRPGVPMPRLGGPRRPPAPPRAPAVGLTALLTLALMATFFAWVSAEPLWLAVGHGDRGTVTIAGCTGAGVQQRCQGQFTAAGGAFTAPGLALLGVDADQRVAGAVVQARMVSRDSRQAFVGGSDATLHLRWLLGVLLVLLCGWGIAAATGARRLETARSRRLAVLISLGGPLALLGGFLVASY